MPDHQPVQYDAIIIGTGQAGPPLASKLTAAGMTVAIVERKRFGGTCVNTGCTPTKALVASARAAYMARRAGDFGVEVGGGITVDMKKVKARKDEIVRPGTEGIERWLRNMAGCTVYTGHARFEGPHEVRVDDTLLQGTRIFVNVGARAMVPDIPGLHSIPYLTDPSIMEIDVLPEHLIILGGGTVALEFGQMYRRFGSEVTIVERGPRLAGKEDADVSAEIREILEREGVHVLTDAEAMAAEHGNDGALELSVQRDGEEIVLNGSHVLVAAGRIPNTGDLGLENVAIKTDERGFIQVDDELRSSQPHVWALGDCNGRGAFTHTSYNDHEVVAANLLDGGNRSIVGRNLVYAIYVDPPLGRAGLTEAQVRDSGRRALIGKMAMKDVARAKERSETAGFMKVLVDADSEEILGAALLGIGCDEVVHLLIDVMAAKAPYTTVRDAVHIHPTVAELIPTLLQDLKPLPANG